MNYKPENVKLVITHNGVEQEVHGFDGSTCIQNPPPKKIKVEVAYLNPPHLHLVR